MKRFSDKKFLAIVAAMTFLIVVVLMTGTRKSSAIPTETLESMKTFADVYSLVQENYAETVDSKKLVHDAIKGMVRGLDPHSSYLTKEEYDEMKVDTTGVFAGLGIEIGMRDNILTVIAPIEDTPAAKAGIMAGDKIIKIGEKYTKEMTITEAITRMRGPKGTSITIHILRDSFSSPKPFEITRAIIKVKSVKYKTLEDGFVYVKVVQFQENTSSDLEKAMKELKNSNPTIKGLVLDLRNNPGGLLQEAVAVSNMFLDSGLIVYTKGRASGNDYTFSADTKKTASEYPMIVIVNGGSASASEIVAGALQDHKRAAILGTTTFGKGSVQTIMPLSDGSALKVTTSKYYTPSGRSIQAKGIEPDIVIGDNARSHMKEKDLEGHLAAEKTDSKKVEKKEKEKEPVQVKFDDNDEKQGTNEDQQLKRALEYLKSWYIFKETTVKKAA